MIFTDQNLNANVKISRLLDFYGNLLSERQRDICQMYFNDDLSLSEISDEVGITRQGVRDCIKKGETLLFSFEEKLRLLSKFEEMQADVQKIIDRISAVKGLSEDELGQIINDAQKILTLM